MPFCPVMKQETEEQEKCISDSQESLLFSPETFKDIALSQGTSDLLSEVMLEPVPDSEVNFVTVEDTSEIKYELNISFKKEGKVTKSCFWTYSKLLNKMFMLMDQLCPFVISTSRPVPPGSLLSVAVAFKRVEDSVTVPARCPTHATPLDPSNYNHSYPRHLIRSDLKNASYIWQQERPLVVIPFPNDGRTSHAFNLKVMCRNSCNSGMDRKPTMIVFTLENSRLGTLASSSVDLRVCSCPGRDRKDEEKKELSKMQGSDLLQEHIKNLTDSTVPDCVPSKRPRLHDQITNGTYEIQTYSKRKYRILCGLKTILDSYLP